jgi:polyisoprenoid-binding protein YceI
MSPRLFTSFLFAFLVACAPDVSDGKVDAVLTVPATTGPVATAEVGREVPIVVAQSRIQALGAKITATHPIVFDKWTGELHVAGDDVVGLDLTIEMASLRADADKLTTHLKTADFFGVDEFPQATFASTALERSATGDATHLVTGDLTIHGVTRRVSFPAKIRTTANVVNASTEFAIDRQDFGIRYPGMPDDLIQDKVVLTIELVADTTVNPGA